MNPDDTHFRFGIISDTHIRNPAGDLSSPFPVNALANERALAAYKTLQTQSLDFIVHLGDMVHPLPHMESYEPAVNCARTLFDDSSVPVHYTPGNHDVGDKPMPGSPAAVVSEQSIATYRSAFGTDHYKFIHESCGFIVVNSSIWNTGLAQENAQLSWLEKSLTEYNGKRIFVISHYPHFVHSRDEDEHYDNIAEPARSKLLNLFSEYKVEAVFSGHVHHFFYNRIDDTSFYILPATSFTRQDYAELFKIAPTAEFGRDDTGKFFVTTVDVSNRNHSINFVPLNDTTNVSPTDQAAAHSKTENSPTTVQVHLRHAWHESIDLPYNGPMEEFSRKRARNDYTLLRLWQIGLKDVRVPLQDFLDETIRTRIQDYQHAGIQFHLFGSVDKLNQAAQQCGELLASITSFELITQQGDPIVTLPPEFSMHKVWLSIASTGRKNDGLYFHSVTSGYKWPLEEESSQAINAWCDSRSFQGIVFQLPWEHDINTLHQIDEWCESQNISATVNIKLAKENPADGNFDDHAIGERIIAAMNISNASKHLNLQLDTYVDIDRGYAPRNGLLDRHFNLRSSAISLINWQLDFTPDG